MSNNEKKIEVFQDLLHITNDRLRGYEKVKESVLNENPAVQQWFESLQQQTYHMQNELMEHIGELGGQFDQDGTTLGAIHRGWIDLKSKIVGDKVDSTLGNVIFGEKAAIKAYENADEEDGLAETCHTIIKGHLGKLKDSLAKAKELEKSLD